MKLDDLIGSPRVDELILQEDKPMKKKMIALNSQTGECSKNDEENFENVETLQEDDNEELTFLLRRIQKLTVRKNQLKKTFQPRRNGFKSKVDMSKIKWHGCDQFRYYKNKCPKQNNCFREIENHLICY
jgi:hypothetical protein